MTGTLGLNRDDILVVYDRQGNFSAPRALWMLRSFNHPLAILLNSYPEYKKLGGEVDTTEQLDASNRSQTVYESPGLKQGAVVSYEELKGIVESPAELTKYYILDARPEGRFTGAAAEPRPGISSGHVPGAISFPFSDLVAGGKLIPGDKVKTLLESKGIKNDKPIIAMCGTGVTACVIEKALNEVEGFSQPVRVYDGSWT
jgi:thiosulfate/3-mercaptopyruvate sulfurtransferase